MRGLYCLTYCYRYCSKITIKLIVLGYFTVENINFISPLLGGALIGISVTLLLLFNGRTTGVSGIMNGVFNPLSKERNWRILFLVGLLVGAFLFQLIEPDSFTPRENYPLWLIAIGGYLVGMGTRIGGGCTSGHGICGIAFLSMRSIVATLTFMAAGMLTVYITKHIIGLV